MIEEDEVDAPELVPAKSRARKKARKEKNINADIYHYKQDVNKSIIFSKM